MTRVGVVVPARNAATHVDEAVRSVLAQTVDDLDADDTWVPDKLEAQLAELARRPELAVYGAALPGTIPAEAPLTADRMPTATGPPDPAGPPAR
jgi:hypothetical protein